MAGQRDAKGGLGKRKQTHTCTHPYVEADRKGLAERKRETERLYKNS